MSEMRKPPDQLLVARAFVEREVRSVCDFGSGLFVFRGRWPTRNDAERRRSNEDRADHLEFPARHHHLEVCDAQKSSGVGLMDEIVHGKRRVNGAISNAHRVGTDPFERDAQEGIGISISLREVLDESDHLRRELSLPSPDPIVDFPSERGERKNRERAQD